ncbi:hypothetical protein EV359DRAFT_66377 [Lentinula novae-zelandiae]|nr:hypothetical protein EV359DRAFT_66377 [Lentinula novae-zelandiae]
MPNSAIYSFNAFKAIQEHYTQNASRLTADQSLAHHENNIKKTTASPFLAFSGGNRIKDVCRKILSKGREQLSEASDIDIATEAFGSRLVLDRLFPTGRADQLVSWFGSPECSLIEGELENLARRVMNGTSKVFKQERKKAQRVPGSGFPMAIAGPKDVPKNTEKISSSSGLNEVSIFSLETYQKGKRPSSGDPVEGAAAVKKATGLKGIFGASEAKGNRKPLAELPKDKNQSNAPQPPVFIVPQSNRSSGHPQARPLSRSAPNSHRHAIYIDNDVSANNLVPLRPDNISTDEAAQTNVSGSDTAPSSVAARMLQPTAVNNVVAPERASGPSSSPAVASDTFNSEGKKGEAQVSMPVPEFSSILNPVNGAKPAYVTTFSSENVTPESNQESSPQSQSKPAYVTTLSSENVIAKSNQESSPQSTPFVATSSDLNTVSEGKSTVIDAASGNSSVSESEQDNPIQDSSTAESSTSAFTFSDPSTMSRNISSSNNAQPLVFSITYNHTHHHHHHHHHVHNHYHAA